MKVERGVHKCVISCQANQSPLCRLVGPCESSRFRLQFRFEGLNQEPTLFETWRRRQSDIAMELVVEVLPEIQMNKREIVIGEEISGSKYCKSY